MKYVLVCLIAFGIYGSVQAQDEISEADLKKYAMLEQVIAYMKKDISLEINKMIKSQEGMTGKRYMELAKTKGNEAKLAAIDAKDYEKQFLELTNKLKANRIEAIKTVNSALATKMIGNKGKTYKAIKEQLKADTDLKARYDSVVAQLSVE